MDKLFKTVSMKAVDEVEGKVEAVFSNFNEVDSDGDVDIDDAKKAVDNAVKGVKQAVAKLPSAAKLKAQTKAQLEELGREFGIELDKRKTKDKMIADLKSGVKAQK